MAHLEIQSREREGVKILDLSGKLAVGGSSELRERVNAETAAGHLQQLLNLKDVEYIDSTGLGTMVICHMALQKAGGTLKLSNLNRRNLELVLLTKLSTVFQIFNEEQEAINSFFPDREIKHFDILSFVQQQKEGAVSRRMFGRRKKTLVAAGAQAPPFQLRRLDGSGRTLADILAGGPALLAFFKISCPVCQLTAPYLERMAAARRAAGDRNLAGRCQLPPQGFMQRFGVTFPTLLDLASENYPASNAYGITSVPSLFLLERDGTIARSLQRLLKTRSGGDWRPRGRCSIWSRR